MTKPGTSAQRIGILRIAWAKRGRRLRGSPGRRVVALDHLDQPHRRRRLEEMQPDHLVGPGRRLADLGDRQRRGVRGEDRVTGRGRVERSANTSCLSARRSGAASITKSTSARLVVAGGSVISGGLRSNSVGSSLPASTPVCQIERAFSRPRLSASGSTSLSATGMSALSTHLAISPPIVPAPTTAALKTNMNLPVGRRSIRAAPGGGRPWGSLGTAPATRRSSPRPRPAHGGVQRGGRRAADEQEVDHRRAGRAGAELVLEREAHVDRVLRRVEGDDLPPADRARRSPRAAAHAGSYTSTRSVTRPRPAGPTPRSPPARLRPVAADRHHALRDPRPSAPSARCHTDAARPRAPCPQTDR